jgi:hypothetical protein
VVVAVIPMDMVQPSADQVIGVAAMGDRGMSAAGSVHVAGACRIGLAPIRGIGADLDHMFVDVIAMHVMQVTVMQVVDVTLMTDRHVAAIFTVIVNMLRMIPP